jgi:small subunit ribosomal protein S7
MRRTKPEKRKPTGDIKYDNVLIQGMINRLMKKGKKSIATGIIYDAFEMIEAKAKRNPEEVFEEAVRNVAPALEVKPRRVGGATYQVPMEVSSGRRISLAMRWILAASSARPGRTMAQRLADELMDASKKTGAAMKRREETHRMAEANRAFAHYRW